MAQKIKVLVVDDSALMRKLISGILNKDPEIEVTDTAMNGLFALKKLKKGETDIVLLDIEMPGMNGLEFLKMRKELKIEVPVVMLSSLGATKPEVTIQALDLGAKDFIIKPSGSISLDLERVANEIIASIKKYGGAKYHTSFDDKKIDDELKKLIESSPITVESPKTPVFETMTQSKPILTPEKVSRGMDFILIGISTGGPAALRQLFGQLKPLKTPILIVQHMPPGFTKEFAKGLDKISSIRVKEAEDNELIKPSYAYIAPGNYHLSLKKRGLQFYTQLLETPPVNGHKPSVEVLFDSAFDLQTSVVGIIMTGMGKDGAHALKKLHQQGNITVAQSPKDCVVFGMPKVAVELGGVDHILEIDQIAQFLNNLEK